MKYEEYKMRVKEAVLKMISDEYEIIEHTDEKYNGHVADYLTIKFKEKENGLYMSHDLKRYFNNFQNDLYKLDDAVKETVEIIKEYIISEANNSTGYEEFKDMVFDYEKIKRRIVYKVLKEEGNEELIKNRVCTKIKGTNLVIFYEIDLYDKIIGIRKDMLEMYGVSESDIRNEAEKNTRAIRGVRLIEYKKLLKNKCILFPITNSELYKTLMKAWYIESNDKSGGYEALFYKDVMDGLAAKLKNRMFIVLLNTGVFLAIAEKDVNDIEKIRLMSKYVYLYNHKSKELTVV